jgi:uncharacterized membrane protein YphA (DoxX/SURF4 family)
MKAALNITRWVVGLLFIFSGLIKANDPLGLSYKMQEFFEAWHWDALNPYTLAFAIGMNIFEVLAGVAVIVGWRMKLFSWLLLLLILFFTFLTSYVLFSGKIKACGCFGDCLPLTPQQTFAKDVVLLLLILFLFFNTKKIVPLTAPKTAVALLALALLLTAAMQWYVLKYLPFADCLPYKKGNHLLQQMKPPANYIPDKKEIVFVYRKNGKDVEYKASELPDLDSTYEYVDRKETLIKGNGLEAKIVDFYLTTLTGNDTTQQVLATPGPYVLLFVKEFNHLSTWQPQVQKVLNHLGQTKRGIPFFIVTADATTAQSVFPGYTILKCDATVIKTAARVTPTFLIMNKDLVLSKHSYANINPLLQLQ